MEDQGLFFSPLHARAKKKALDHARSACMVTRRVTILCFAQACLCKAQDCNPKGYHGKSLSCKIIAGRNKEKAQKLFLYKQKKESFFQKSIKTQKDNFES